MRIVLKQARQVKIIAFFASKPIMRRVRFKDFTSLTHPSMIGVTVLGATGSLGRQILAVLAGRRDRFRIRALVASSRGANELSALAELYRADSYWHDGLDEKGLSAILNDEATGLIVLAVGGEASFRYYRLLLSGEKDLAIASKEALLIGGRALFAAALKSGRRIFPLDSEMVALRTLCSGITPDAIDCVTITGSGGPFLDYSLAALNTVTPQNALTHPRWSMGPKISVESALWINKGYEILEAHILFGLPLAKINVLIHPEAQVHALARLKNGATLAQMHDNDMSVALGIAFADYLGESVLGPDSSSFALAGKTLRFFAPDSHPLQRGIALVLRAWRLGLISEFIARTDGLVADFLASRLAFTAIYEELEIFLNRAESLNNGKT